MDKRVRFIFRQKLSAVMSVVAGQESYRSAGKKIGVSSSSIHRWVSFYKEHGAKGLNIKRACYDGPFKVRVVRYMLKNKLSLVQTAAFFAISQDEIVRRWLKIYQRHGIAGLLKKPGGRKKSLMAKKSTRNKKDKALTDPAVEKLAALQEEVEYLRAENAFLKKLDALIQQEQAAKAQNKQPKPSGN